MNKKKSIALLVVISVVLVVLAVLTFAQFRLPWNDTRIYRSFLGAIELDSDLEEGVAYELTLKEDISVEDTDIEPDEVVLTLERRLEALGYRGAQVTAYRADETENWSFRVEMRSSNTAADDIAVAARYGELEFTDGNGTYLFGSEMVAGARYISQTVQATTSYYVELRFTNEGITALREAIAAGSTDSEGNAADRLEVRQEMVGGEKERNLKQKADARTEGEHRAVSGLPAHRRAYKSGRKRYLPPSC